MERLKKFLLSSGEPQLIELIERPLKSFNGLENFDTLKEALNNYTIWPNAMEVLNFNIGLLKYVEERNEIRNINLMKNSIFLIAILFLIFPLLVGNYWLYFSLILIPLGVMASGILRNPLKLIFWLIMVILGLVAVLSKNYEVLGVVFLSISLKYLQQKAKTTYRDAIIKYSCKNELNFKFYYYLNLIVLYNKNTDEIIRYDE